MENNDDLLEMFNSSFNEVIDNEYTFKKFYLNIRNEYPDYSVNDLIIKCKLDKLKNLGLISSEIHKYLIKIYNYRYKLIYVMSFCELSKDDFNKAKMDIVKINRLFNEYGLLPENAFDTLISESIKNYDFSNLNEKSMRLINNLKYEVEK